MLTRPTPLSDLLTVVAVNVAIGSPRFDFSPSNSRSIVTFLRFRNTNIATINEQRRSLNYSLSNYDGSWHYFVNHFIERILLYSRDVRWNPKTVTVSYFLLWSDYETFQRFILELVDLSEIFTIVQIFMHQLQITTNTLYKGHIAI